MNAKVAAVLPLLITLACLFSVTSFSSSPPPCGNIHKHQHSSFSTACSSVTTSSSLYLIPISKFRSDLTFLSDPEARFAINEDGTFRESTDGKGAYELCLAEEKDLPDLSRFIVTCFGSDAIRLSQDLTAFERMLMQPAAELLNGYSGIIAFAEVLSGLRQRLSNRLSTTMDISAPKLKGLSREEKIKKSAKESIVLVLGRRHPREDDWHIDIIASVELRLELCDAKIPFSLPWLDRAERRISAAVGLGKNSAGDLKPYLSTLCVDKNYRGKKLGQALVHCVEDIAAYWGYSRLYLHVDPDNKPAYNLYKNMNYKDVGIRWNPFWAGKAANIAYLCKNNLDKVKAKKAKVLGEELFSITSSNGVKDEQNKKASIFTTNKTTAAA